MLWFHCALQNCYAHCYIVLLCTQQYTQLCSVLVTSATVNCNVMASRREREREREYSEWLGKGRGYQKWNCTYSSCIFWGFRSIGHICNAVSRILLLSVYNSCSHSHNLS